MGKFKDKLIDKMNNPCSEVFFIDEPCDEKQSIWLQALSQTKVHPHKYMANKKVWITSKGEALYYQEMETSHIKNCIAMFEEGLLDDRLYALKGLKQELMSRETAAGKVLYADSK